MKNKRNIAKNYLYNVSYQIISIILPLITTPYLSRVLGAEAIGIYSYTLSITTYFVLLGSLGVALYGKREIAYVQNDIKERTKRFWEIILLKVITLTISMVVFYFSFITNGEYTTYYKIFILEIISTMLDISWFFQGVEEFKKTVVRNTIVRLISVSLIFILIKTPEDLIKYIIIYVLSNLLGNLTLWLYLPKYIKKIKLRDLNIRRHVKPTISLFIPQIATEIYRVLDKTMLGSMIADKKETGYYEQAQKMIKLLITIVTSLGSVMLPRMASVFAKKDKKEIKSNIYNSFRFVFFLAIPIMLGICMVSDSFVPIFYGNEYEKVSSIIKVISPIILAFAISNVTGTQYLLAARRQKEFTVSVMIGALLNVIINFTLIPSLKSIGVSLGTVIAEVTVAGIQLYMLRKELNVKDILKMSINYFIAGIVMVVVCLLVDIAINNNLISILMQIALGGVTYFICLIMIKDEFFKKIINFVSNKITGKIKKEV